MEVSNDITTTGATNIAVVSTVVNVDTAANAAATTNVNVCIGCGKTDSKSQCSRCDGPYCGRECQVNHWSEHKKACVPTIAYRNRTVKPADQRERLIAQLYDRVCKVIAGNVIILNAWYRQSCGRVEIEITETLMDFSQPSTHFLHMKYVDLPDDADCKYSDPSRCFIKFMLTDHEYESVINIKIPANIVKAKQIQPSREWTLMYDLE